MRLHPLTRHALLLALLLASGVVASTTGRLEGIVRAQESRLPIQGASVLIVETRQGAVSDEHGQFTIPNIHAGVYQVRVTMIGYRTMLYDRVTILPDLRVKLAVDLLNTPLQMDGIVVTAERPVIQTDITGTAYDFSTRQLEQLPIEKFQQVVGLQPGTTAEGHIRGGKIREVLYLVDGAPVQDVISGGLGAELPKSAVSQLSVKTGGFDAEYGNALSGIVQVITRSGGDDHQLEVRADKDNLFGGTQVSRTTDAEITFSGPLRRRKAHYFIANNLLLSDTRWWQDMHYFFKSPIRKELFGFAKVDWLFSGEKRLSGQALYTISHWRDYEFSWRYNLDGLPERRSAGLRGSLNWTHTLSPTLFYSASLYHNRLHSNIGRGVADSVTGAPYAYDFYLLYVIQGDRVLWADMDQKISALKAEVTSQWRPAHVFKAGVEYKYYDINSVLRKMEPQRTYFGKPVIELPQLNYSSDYRYFPRSGSLFIQNKYESPVNRSVISLGLRLDFLDPRASRPAVELIPAGPDEYREEITASVKAQTQYHISPRIGFASPLTDKSYFFVNWGRYVQYPLFEHLYAGLNNVELQRGVKVLRGNPDLLAEKTSALEISVRHNLHENMVASVLYFKKETRDQIDTKTFVPSNSRIAGDYGFAEYVNNPYAIASGFELMLSREKGKWLTGDISYTLMQARGLSETENQGMNYAQWGFAVANHPYYLSWDQRHTFKMNLYLELPREVHVILIGQYHTGRPYTYYPSRDGFSADHPGIRFLPNNRRMPGGQLLDLRIGKTFRLASTPGAAQVQGYVDIQNLFNSHNVLWIDSSGRSGGELHDPAAFGIGRRTSLGLHLTL